MGAHRSPRVAVGWLRLRSNVDDGTDLLAIQIDGRCRGCNLGTAVVRIAILIPANFLDLGRLRCALDGLAMIASVGTTNRTDVQGSLLCWLRARTVTLICRNDSRLQN